MNKMNVSKHVTIPQFHYQLSHKNPNKSLISVDGICFDDFIWREYKNIIAPSRIPACRPELLNIN